MIALNAIASATSPAAADLQLPSLTLPDRRDEAQNFIQPVGVSALAARRMSNPTMPDLYPDIIQRILHLDLMMND